MKYTGDLVVVVGPMAIMNVSNLIFVEKIMGKFDYLNS